MSVAELFQQPGVFERSLLVHINTDVFVVWHLRITRQAVYRALEVLRREEFIREDEARLDPVEVASHQTGDCVSDCSLCEEGSLP